MHYRSFVLTSLATVATVSLNAVLPLSAQEPAKYMGRVQPVKQQLVGPGTWQSHRNGGDDRSWHIQLKQLDDDPEKNWVIGPSSH